MYLELTADERDVAAGTRKFLAATAGAHLLREREDDESPFDDDWWQGGAALGWVAPLVPEERGGGSVTGTPMRELGLVAHELGSAAAPGPVAVTNAVLAGLVRAGGAHSPVSDATLAAIVVGETTVTWAAGDGGPAWRPFETPVRITRTKDGLRLDGECPLVELAGPTDLLLVSAMRVDGPALVLVPAHTAGVSVEPVWGLDLSRRWARVVLDGVQLPVTALVAAGPEAEQLVEHQLRVLAALQCADTCGVLDTVFEMTREWVDHRWSFGRPLASYQALKHRLADVRTLLEACRATTEAALDAIDADAPDAGELVSVASAFVGEHAPGMVQECVQLHGGIGVTWEHDLHVHLRRVVTNAAAYGSPTDHRRRLADVVTEGS
ncbi:acyl-CoA dehydrogenase family protein [Nocardioides marmotae]|uniref:acyl-CoA dehydrogenase family protein n=1 Tax=Nocardioides marmotae TaxID=2663857 RepID=UPI0012B5628C|nr:acyl-CoA dehydrogenase family protein [Nocardioides marmotae]MBC9734433.1 acyl-CoA/acyl-ACP dehydrogenase [Nocardioides marmotae]MTB85533.1 acyl-CoA dehydrogenase [Nocardioides marmotae]